MISIIIPSIRENIRTLSSLRHYQVPHQLIITRELGLGYARDFGVMLAEYELVVFLDDDIDLKPNVWRHILTTEQGEFKMTHVGLAPCSRVFVIHKKDFWKVGGFDQTLSVTSEDTDFYFRAIDYGLKFTPIPTLAEGKPDIL